MKSLSVHRFVGEKVEYMIFTCVFYLRGWKISNGIPEMTRNRPLAAEFEPRGFHFESRPYHGTFIRNLVAPALGSGRRLMMRVLAQEDLRYENLVYVFQMIFFMNVCTCCCF